MSAPSPLPLKRGYQKLSTDALIDARNNLNYILDERARQWSLFEDRETAEVSKVRVVTRWPLALSPSSLNTWMGCQARWWYRKILCLPEKRTLALGLGSAVHQAVAKNFSQKIDSKRDLPLAAVTDAFHAAFEAQLEEVTLTPDDDIADTLNCGDAMIRVYMEQAAPAIQPAAVELPVHGEIGAVPVSGIVDLMDTAGNIIDLKTAAKKPGHMRPDHKLQLTTYTMLTPQCSGRGRIDTLTKTKTVSLHSQTVDITYPDKYHARQLYSIALEQMQSGLVTPNRGSWSCSRKNCSYWEQCVEDYGGSVAD